MTSAEIEFAEAVTDDFKIFIFSIQQTCLKNILTA